MSPKPVDDNRRPRTKEHPDNQKVSDWFLFGPKDGRIALLVEELVVERGMRIADVEELIFSALKDHRDR